ncbi:transmembrane alpha-helix domain-containing protein [Colletotrichum plurivorum]|uniref:Transmembrane alpha-helix domain-containing protein n=1 Tax=Colletotrichum plurivorum TaxID=2175906 RepID=A0A8H6JX89_9PEZI|nr:transmembrane alpha-helix domain-containing protein [Colletotrichum plurivorum]
MAVAELDSNVWYVLTTARKSKIGEQITSCLQDTSVGPRVFPCRHETVNQTMLWQFQPLEAKAGRYVMRLKNTGLREQFSVCWEAEEVYSTKTRGCLRTSTSDESQQWDVADWGDGMFDLANVANDTGYRLDVHPDSNSFMNDESEGKEGVVGTQYAQRWIMTSHAPVNNKALSTIIFSQALGCSDIPKPTTSTATTQPTGETAAGGLSAGAYAGIGIGAGIVDVAFLGVAAIFWRNRRRNKTPQARYSNEDHGEAKVGPSHGHNQTYPPEADANPVYEAHSEPPVHQLSGNTRPHRHEMP